jgi:hypothetical protein
MQKMSLKKLNEILDGTERALLFLKSDSCDLCHQFEPIVCSLEGDYTNDIKFFVCSDESEEVAGALTEQIDGVPSIVLFKADHHLVIPDPTHPDPNSWYTREYIDQFLKEW